MNEEQAKSIEINRQQTRILNGLTTAFSEAGSKESKLLVAEAAAELEDYEKKVYQVEQPTVAELVQSIFESSNSVFTGNDFSVDDLQDLINQDVSLLAEILGIELEEPK